ncbi:50S ribosomal protein L11 methyltransferase [Marinibacterium profundimaris]|uniref:50S ribosomal protein L11 methyltransferase n=1 Tax=Marinibacterium profundimaris TaxID=1679460 RepID=UPI0013036374|nr:50S ribosomal protein L11 methyltransferase [Marinibacterium profundimaris]
MTNHDGLPVAAAFRPSAYTAAVLRQLLERRVFLKDASVLDIGCGCGILLAGAGEMGATSLCGVDIEPAAVNEARRLLTGPGAARFAGAHKEVLQGSLFEPVAGRTFDVILANLPHFPMDHVPIEERLATWSSGGDDGRRLLDPVIDGIGAHLVPGGWALIAHNAFIGLDATRERAAAQGLEARVVDTILVPLEPRKLAWMTAEVLEREIGRTIHRFADHVFAEVAVLHLRHLASGTAA